MSEPPVERELEAVSLPLEVLLELPTRLVDPPREGENARRDALGEVLQHVVQVLAREGHPDEPTISRGHGHLADRGIHGRVGDVQKPLFRGPGGQSLEEIVHLAISFSSAALRRSFFKPSCTFRRAPSSEVPSASPTSR